MKATKDHIRLFRNGKNRTLRIPREFELPGEALIHKEGDRLIIEPIRKKSLLKLLESWEPFDEGLADVDEDLLPLDDVKV